MQINNVNLNNVEFQKSKQVSNQTEEKPAVQEKNITMMPDIRLSQVVLPDNKIYLPQGSKPADFNKKNITVEVPESYAKVASSFEDTLTLSVKKIFNTSKVNQYRDVKTGEEVIRISKNNFSEDGVLDSSEVMEVNIRKTRFASKFIKDFEHNTETEIIYSTPLVPTRSEMESMTTIHKDENGKVVKTEKYTKSPYLRGVYDIEETDAAGNKTVISKTEQNPDGSIVLEKNLTSFDGTKTEYKYVTDKDGRHKTMFCQIKDADGKVLSTIDRTYDKEGDNVTYSSVNGNKFKAVKENGSLEITNYTTGEKTKMNPADFAASDETKFLISTKTTRKREFSQENVMDKMFDTLPADTLLTINSNIKEVVPLKDDMDSAFMGIFDYLMCKTDPFVIGHELGHSKDSKRVPEDANLMDRAVVKELKKNVIADKENFYKEYVAEKAAFVKKFPDFEEKFISYFINSPETKPSRGRKETVAESNAINGIEPQEPERISIRTIFLQRYFPRSIAELTKMMNAVAIDSNQQ